MLNYILIILHFILEKLLKLFLLIRIRVKIHHFCADKAEYFSYSDQNVPRIQNKLVVTFPKEKLLWINILYFENNKNTSSYARVYFLADFTWYDYDFKTYNFPLLNIIEKNEITKHCDKTEKPQTSHDVNHCVLQIKLS